MSCCHSWEHFIRLRHAAIWKIEKSLMFDHCRWSVTWSDKSAQQRENNNKWTKKKKNRHPIIIIWGRSESVGIVFYVRQCSCFVRVWKFFLLWKPTTSFVFAKRINHIKFFLFENIFKKQTKEGDYVIFAYQDICVSVLCTPIW